MKYCKIHHLNLEKALLFPENQVICLKNWKLWRAQTATEFNIFCWNFAQVSYLPMSTKEGSGISRFLWVCANEAFFTFILASNSRSK